MNDYISKITLDLNCNKNIQTVRAGQFDVGRKIEITVTADGESFDVADCTAVLKICRSDKSCDAISCDITDNKIIATLDKNTLSVRGLSVAKITISDSLKTFSTQSFLIDVNSSLESDITAAEKYSILNDLIQQVHLITEQGGIIVDNYPSLSSTNPLANNILTALLNNKANKSALDDKQNIIVLDDAPTLGSTNFVNSDRIAAALSYKANGEDLSKKADKTDVDSALNLKADKTSVDDNFATKENLINKVNTIDSSITDVNKYPSVTALLNYLSEFYYDFEETDDLLSKKYDAQNIESGSGTFTPYSSSVAIVKSADFVYQKVGNMVTLNVNAVLNAGTNGNIIFTDLPFVCKNSVNPRELCITNNKTVRIWAINRNSTWLNLIAKDVSTFTQDETLAFTLTYQIA